MSRFGRFFRRALGIAVLAVLVFGLVRYGRFIGPAVFLTKVWIHDSAFAPLPPPVAGAEDVSRLERNPNETPAYQAPTDLATAEKELGEVVRRTAAKGGHIAVSGSRHSMGGQTWVREGVTLDMRTLRHMQLDEKGEVLTVGVGARWKDVIPMLDGHGRSISVMQSNSDFTVGGSLSVNCHGWQHDSSPIASTVLSLRLLQADGSVVTCSRQPDENPELFRLVLGGYGLFGVILEARLATVPNEFYQDSRFSTSAENYDQLYHELMEKNHDIGMAYGRISVAPESFLKEGLIMLLRRQPDAPAYSRTLTGKEPAWYKRIVVRGSVGSDYGKNVRWRLEKEFGESGKKIRSRNEVMDEPSEWFSNRDPQATEVLHEYFVPVKRLAEFLKEARPVFEEYRPDLLNITVRQVQPDKDTFLAYAREEVFGLVMLFHLPKDQTSDEAMKPFTRALTDVALKCGATYYLPYRLHATREQMQAAYPQAAEFFALKKRYDPQEVFQNEFYRAYAPEQ